MAREKKLNLSASIWARLLQLARAQNIDPMTILKRYIQERFLYRVGLSSYRDKLILKGALMLVAYQIPSQRPTKDVDLLGENISGEPDALKRIISEIAGIEYPDGLTFDVENILVENIIENARYTGLRTRIPVNLGKIQDRLQIDVGFGDIIIPNPVMLDYPVILDLEHPSVMTYSLESAIAEKFEAIVSLGELNSRMKDFYDINFMAARKTFRSDILRKAIETTFNQRNSKLEHRKSIWQKSFCQDNDRKKLWRAFLETNHLALVEFEYVVIRLAEFIDPLLTFNEMKTWSPNDWKWVD